jgi:O-antigen biosynthesis alpha-1,2-rhamnosyltransferase
MASRKLHCFVDCTETICTGINTGIQRTVRNIIRRHALISNAYRIKIVPVVSLNGKFYRYNVDRDRKYCAHFVSNVFGFARNLLDKAYYGKNVDVETLSAVSNDSLAPYKINSVSGSGGPDVPGPNSFHLRIIEFCRKIIPIIFRIAFYIDKAFDGFNEVAIESSDIIFYPDAFWHRSTYLTFARYDAIKVVLLHDIIPLTMPEFCDEVFTISFKKCFNDIIPCIDGVISISQSELTTIKTYLASNHMNLHALLDYNYWGADFFATRCDPDDINPCIVEALAGQQTFIMVGTLEPRKNHAFVLDAFDRYWHQGGTASLCIIGKVSVHCQHLKARIDAHHYLGTRLFCFQNVSDVELAYSYEICAGVIFASLAEGFGLPLVEAMWYGRPVLSSDIGVFREIGGDYPRYFSPNDVHGFVEGLKCILASTTNYKQPRQWLSWDESVRNLFGKILQMSIVAQMRRRPA